MKTEHTVGPTGGMTTRETADYLAKQQAARWPGSKSIRPNGRAMAKHQKAGKANNRSGQ